MDHHDPNEQLDAHHEALHEQAHFVGPPEEDPVLETFFCPFKTYPKTHDNAKEHPADLAYLKEVIHHNEHDPAIVWFGLFTDLIFVAIIVKFADQFKYFYKYESVNYYGADKDEFYVRIIGETLLFFYAFFTVWLELAQGNTRFCNLKGALDDFLYLLYLCGIIIMAVQMHREKFLLENKVGFLAGMLICFVAITCLHVQYHQKIPRAKAYTERRMISYSIAVLVLSVALVVAIASDDDSVFANWFVVFSVVATCTGTLGIALISFRFDPRYPHWTLEYFEERFGILVMIVTGESILALILGDQSSYFKYYLDENSSVVYYQNSQHYYIYQDTGAFLQYGGNDNFDDYLGVFIAFATMYIIKNIYFESKAEEHEHALNEEGHPGAVMWVLMHFPLTFSLLGCGVGYKLVFTALHDDEAEEGFRLMLGFCLCSAILCMLIIRAAHDKFVFPVQSMCIRIPTAIVIPLGVLFFKNAIDYMLWCFAFVTLSWIYDLTILQYLEVKGAHEEEVAHHGGEDQTAKNTGICGQAAEVCGFVDKEYQGAFHGPKHEGHPGQLLMDVICFRICDEAAPAPGEFPPAYLKEISTPHTAHGHGGHDEHGHGHENPAEAGADHGWFGEFTDLIFVSVIIKFADQMKYKQTTMYQEDDELVTSDWDHARIYLEAALYFTGFFICWLELTHMLIRFRNMPGVFDDLMYFFYLFGVIGMAIQMNHLEYLMQRRSAFCCWFAFCMFCLVVLHVKFYQIDAAEAYCRLRIVTFSCTAVLAIVGGFLREVSCGILLSLSYVVALFISLNSFRVWQESQANEHIQEEYIERFGLIVMITTGESILALILADFEQKFEYYAIVLLAFCTMYTLKLIYFASHSEEPAMHALSEGNMPGSVLWAFMHCPAAFFLTGAGVGYKMLLNYATESNVDTINRLTLGFSIAGVLLSFLVIRAAHNKFTLPLASMFIRFPVAALAPAAAWYIEAPLSYVTWCFCITLVSYSLDLLLIDQLKFEIDLDFVHHLHQSHEKRNKRIAHVHRVSRASRTDLEVELQKLNEADHHHTQGHHGDHHHGDHHSGHQGDHHSGHHGGRYP